MRVISNERVIAFDIDETLVMSVSNRTPTATVKVIDRLTVEPEDNEPSDLILIQDPYEGRKVWRRKHIPHIRLLRNYAARGAFIIVWSKNGHRWASEVLKALGLDQLKIQVMTKPFAYVDDCKAEAWMGDHVYIKPEDSFGRD